jgi:hypothetical protein
MMTFRGDADFFLYYAYSIPAFDLNISCDNPQFTDE